MRIASVICIWLVVLCPAVSSGFSEPAFRVAKPVWQTGHRYEKNEQLVFRGSFEQDGPACPLLRIAASNPYRVTTNGVFAWYGPARGPKGFFRVDEIPLPAAGGRTTVEIECAGYNCANFYFQKQPSFLQAEVDAGDKVCLRTDGCPGKDVFSACRSCRVQKVSRYSHARAFGEAYRLPQEDTQQLELSVCEAGVLIPRIVPSPDFAVADDFSSLAVGPFGFDEAVDVKTVGFVEQAGTADVDGFAKASLDYDLWDSSQRFKFSHGVKPSDSERLTIAAGQYALFGASRTRTGFLSLSVTCEKPGELHLLFDELLVNGELRPWRSSVANSAVWRFDRPGEYVIETFEPYVLKDVATAARSGRFAISPPRLRQYRNAASRRVAFHSSDPELDALFVAAEENFAQNAVDGFMDCPGRERANWNCDAYFTSRASFLLTGDISQETLFLDNYARPVSFDNIDAGMIPMCYPADFLNGNFIPSWALFLVLQLEEYARERGGDPALIERLKPRVLDLINYLSKYRNAEGLLENLPQWVFVEWSKANDYVKGVNYPNNMVWAAALEAAGRLYSRKDLVADAERTRETIRRMSYDGRWFRDQSLRQEDGTLKATDASSETCQYYAFAFGTATKELYPDLYRVLAMEFGPERVRNGRYPQIWESAPFIGNFLRLDWLGREGYVARQISEMKGYFGHMVKSTGTIWENAHSADNGSCCHGFASHVSVFLLRDVLGLRKIDIAKRELVLSPSPDVPLSFCLVTLPVGGHLTRIGWRRADGKVEYSGESLPEGWKVLMPGGDRREVK